MKNILKIAVMLVAMPIMAMAAAPVTGEMAPTFETVDINGNAFKLADHKGDIVVLEWTNHQCPFVKKYYDKGDMQKLQKAYTDKGVKWVRIVSSAPEKQGHTTNAEALEIIAEGDIAATATLLDESGEIGKLYAAKTTPHMFVIDKEGKLVYQGAIDSIASASQEDIAKAEPYVAQSLDQLLAGEEVTIASTRSYGCSVKY